MDKGVNQFMFTLKQLRNILINALLQRDKRGGNGLKDRKLLTINASTPLDQNLKNNAFTG